MAMPKGQTVHNTSGHIVATQGLTDQQKAFVARYLANGGDQKDAAEYAQYAFPSQAGYQLMRRAHIQSAINKEMVLKLGGRLASLAFNELEAILTDTRNCKDFKRLKLDAAKTVLDRAGHVAPKDAGGAAREKELTDMSVEELEAFIRKGREAQAGANKPLIEGESAPVGESGTSQDTDNQG